MASKHYLEAELDSLAQVDESMWRFLQQGSLDGCWYWDLEDPENEWMSPEFWELFGVDPATKKHDPAEWQDLIFPEDRDLALENFRRHCEDPSHPYDQIVRYRHQDGSTVWVRCRGLAIRDENGKPIRMLGAHNDLTAAKRAEEQALAEKRAADVASEELRSFAYAVSHDLKSPSNTIALLLAELRGLDDGKPIDLERDELLGLAESTVARMRSLIEDLLNYTRLIEDGHSDEHVDLNLVVADAVAEVRAEIVLAGAEIDVAELPVVIGHPRHLRAMFQNLLSNALKFRKLSEPCRIKVDMSAGEGSRVEISVADNGLGIRADQQERIFKMFQRLHNNKEIPGHGLGLSLCRRIALNHGGDITVNSILGEGSTFTVSLMRS